MSDLREGLAKTLLDGQIVFTHERAAINLIDELVKVIRQHDGHAELVRAVKAFCLDRSLHRHEKLTEIESLCDRTLCEAELAKEQNNE